MTLYRVIKTTTIGFHTPEVEETTVWEGTDLTVLSSLYPPSDTLGADRLGHLEIEDGFIRSDHHFEVLLGGLWAKVPDPRKRVTPMTAIEREIERENRRDFPGDYI